MKSVSNGERRKAKGESGYRLSAVGHQSSPTGNWQPATGNSNHKSEIINLKSPISDLRPPTSPRAFTLVEILVVMIIIGLLAGLILAAAGAARRAARRAAVVAEINQLQQSMQQYQNQYGSFPPNAQDEDALVRHFKKAFPRINRDELLLVEAIAGVSNPGSGSQITNVTGLSNGPMNAAEAVVFWLGGFSKDPQHPISGAGGPSELATDPALADFSDRNKIFNFDVGRIGPTTLKDVRTIKFNVGSQQREIRLYGYYPAKVAEHYVYFDTSRSKFDNLSNYMAGRDWPIYTNKATNRGVVRAYVKNSGKKNGSGNPIPEFVNSDSFQILAAGLDGYWSAQPGSADWDKMWREWPDYAAEGPRPFPDGPFVGEMEDNLANFTTGTLGDAK